MGGWLLRKQGSFHWSLAVTHVSTAECLRRVAVGDDLGRNDDLAEKRGEQLEPADPRQGDERARVDHQHHAIEGPRQWVASFSATATSLSNSPGGASR